MQSNFQRGAITSLTRPVRYGDYYFRKRYDGEQRFLRIVKNVLSGRFYFTESHYKVVSSNDLLK